MTLNDSKCQNEIFRTAKVPQKSVGGGAYLS